MKYYSDRLNKVFNTVEDLEAAENELTAKEKELELRKTERAAAAKKVDEAFKAAKEAQRVADEALREFCKKYGSYHKTITDPKELEDKSFLDFIFDFPFFF